jgi:hypothetical protein
MVVSSLRIQESIVLNVSTLEGESTVGPDPHHPSDAAPHASRVETLAVCWLCMMHVCMAEEIISSAFVKYTE